MTNVLRRGVVAVITTVTAAALLAACSSGSNEPDDGAALTEIKVGVLSNVAVAPIYLGLEKGFFEDEGLDVELVVASSGSAIVPAVSSGDMQFGFSNVASIITAHQKGLPIQLVAPGLYVNGENGQDQGVAVAGSDSGIQSLSDLEGRTIGTTSLGGMFTLTMRHLIEEAGVDPSSISFVELSYPEVLAALERKEIDAGMLSEPFTTKALEAGHIPLAWPYLDSDPNLMISAYFASDAYVESNPEVIDAFTAAMNRSLDFAQDNEEEARRILGTYTDLSAEDQANMILPRWSSEIDEKPLEFVAQLLVKDGQFEDADISDLVRK